MGSSQSVSLAHGWCIRGSSHVLSPLAALAHKHSHVSINMFVFLLGSSFRKPKTAIAIAEPEDSHVWEQVRCGYPACVFCRTNRPSFQRRLTMVPVRICMLEQGGLFLKLLLHRGAWLHWDNKLGQQTVLRPEQSKTQSRDTAIRFLTGLDLID